MSVINGTAGNDRITPDTISGGVTGNPSAFPDDGADELHGHGGSDFLAGGGGADVIFGDDLQSQAGNDTLDGGAGADSLVGANGNDVYVVDDAGDQVFEAVGGTAGGVDRVQSSVIDIDLDAYGSGLENATLLGNLALSVYGSAANNVLVGNGGDNFLLGRGGNDTQLGGGGGDTVLGNDGNDSLDGQAGRDHLEGDNGNDTLLGGPGGDVLVGGPGRDVFSFGKLIGSVPGAMDEIFAEGDVALAPSAPAFEGAGAAAGDRIDMSHIDANTTLGGQQGFVFGGTGKGRISLVDSGTDTIVRANMDNDAAFEFQLAIHDGNVRANAYTAADFILEVV